MSFSNDITINADTFSRIITRDRMGVFQNGAAELVTPETLTISHEKAKSGKISSVIYIDYGMLVPCNDTCAIEPTMTTLRGQFKLSYNPVLYGADIDANIDSIIGALVTFLSDSANVAKFKNQES